MNRATPHRSRVSLFQNVFDLLEYEPGVCPQALALIEETEDRIGRRLPGALRDWYSRRHVVEIGPEPALWRVEEDDCLFPLLPPQHEFTAEPTEPLWSNYVGDRSNDYSWPDCLSSVLGQIDDRLDLGEKRRGYVRVMIESYNLAQWWVNWTTEENPPVLCDVDSNDPANWSTDSATFSDFVFGTISRGYVNGGSPIAEPSDFKRYRNGLWLRAPDEPLLAPLVDFLCETVGEPERSTRDDGTTTYEFRLEDGTIRATLDPPDVEEARSSWWVHGASEEAFLRLAKMVLPWGSLLETVRAGSSTSRHLVERAKDELRRELG